MTEPKVESLISSVLCRVEVLQSLRLGHGIPPLIAPLVPPHIVDLDQTVDYNVHAHNGEQLLLAAAVLRGVVGSVDVGGNDGTSLHKHVVARGRDGSQSDAVRVARVPGHLDGMG